MIGAQPIWPGKFLAVQAEAEKKESCNSHVESIMTPKLVDDQEKTCPNCNEVHECSS